MADNTDLIEQIKQKTSIEDVIEETHPLQHRRGRYLHGRENDSLVIDVNNQAYHWNSQDEHGDVFTWLEKRRGWDFKSAAEWLAERLHLARPVWSKQDNETRVAARAREDALEIAVKLFERWLWADAEALAYVQGRGWTEETIRGARLGFTGRPAAAINREMTGELQMHGYELDGIEATLILGYEGNVVRWGEKHNIQVQDNWVEWGRIPGMMGKTRLVYPHIYGGRVRYLSARNILGAEITKEGREIKSYNLPVALVGERQVYFNAVWSSRAEELVLVEGQADAVTLGQWGVAGAALAGTGWQDHSEWLKGLKDKHETIYVGMDADGAGTKAVIGAEHNWPLARMVGPLARLVTWGESIADPAERETVKDANDWLKYMTRHGVERDEQAQHVEMVLAAAAPMVVAAGRWAHGLKGVKREKGTKTVMELAAMLDKYQLAAHREAIRTGLEMPVREFGGLLKAAQDEAGGSETDAPDEIKETLGGWYHGWLLEYVYDPERKEARLAYRDPEGKIGCEKYLDIEGVRYAAMHPTSMIEYEGVLFPSGVGQSKTTRELVGIVEAFIHSVYLLDDQFFGRMAAYYVLLTWMYDAFEALPYLRATGDYGSGKSELMRRIGHVCYRMINMGGALTSASLFRVLDKYRGTAFMDELDLKDGGDMANDVIKVLNLGAMKNNSVTRLEQVIREDGTRTYEEVGYNVFGPKLIAMRGEFHDRAVSSRCLTVKLMAKEPLELRNAGVALHMSIEFYQRARNLRNLLLRWRLEHWQPEIPMTEELMDIFVPARLNQVTMPLKAIAQDDPELMKDIVSFVRALNDDLILERGMGLDARVLDALVAVSEQEKYKEYLVEGTLNGFGTVKYVYVKYLAEVANQLMDKMNLVEHKEEEGEETGGKRKKKEGITAHTIGRIARQDLQFKAHRMPAGYVVVIDEGKLAALKMKYGLMKPEMSAPNPHLTPVPSPERRGVEEEEEMFEGDQPPLWDELPG